MYIHKQMCVLRERKMCAFVKDAHVRENDNEPSMSTCIAEITGLLNWTFYDMTRAHVNIRETLLS